MFCAHCSTPLISGAKFCHQCGRPSPQLGAICAKCGTNNLVGAKFCSACAHPFDTPVVPEPVADWGIDWSDVRTLPTQLRIAFCDYLQQQLLWDGEQAKKGEYLVCFEKSGFRAEVFEPSSLQWTSDWEQAEPTRADTEAGLDEFFRYNYLEFLCNYAQDLLPAPLSPNILEYENIRPTPCPSPQMVVDYLNLHESTDNYYTQAVEIPLSKLKNAQAVFFKHSAQPPMLFIDQSIFGTGKEGLVLNAWGIQWKNSFHPAAAFAYDQIQTLVRKPKYLEINGIYLHTNEQTNYRLLKLLQKIVQFGFAH